MRKVLEESRRYVRKKMLSLSSQTRDAVRVVHTKSELLQECLIVQFRNLEESKHTLKPWL